MKRTVMTTRTAAANTSGTMEADTISKHGQNSKSQMSRGNKNNLIL
jgi:hypothetical protein